MLDEYQAVADRYGNVCQTETQQQSDERGPVRQGLVANDTDCEDGDPDTYPGALEINDGRDNQCPGDEGYGAADEISGEVGFNNPDDKNTYSWIAQPGATLYEVARSTAPDHSLDCTTVQTAETFWEDLEEPSPGRAFHYLTRPVAPHAGSWGQDSSSSERTNVCP